MSVVPERYELAYRLDQPQQVLQQRNFFFAADAMEAGVKIAVCSTSNEKAVQTIVDVLLTEASSEMPVFAGDIVSAKKPDPAIYKLAAAKLEVEPQR